MQTKIEVGILGATGMVGQHFVKFLQNHPWFDLKWLGASDRSAGKPYHAATAWRLAGAMPDSIAGLHVEECKPGNAPRLLFSAMDASVATEIERAFAQAGHVVVSNSKNHRMEPDVPLLVPEVNPDHLKLIPGQQRNRGWKGQIVTNPNCSTIVLTMALGPLKPFGITRVITTTLQAISGAGYPGVPSMDINANVIPYIGGEEEKMQQETQKILGDFRGEPHRAARRQSQRALQSRPGGRRPHRHGLGRVLFEALRSRPAPRLRPLHQRAPAAPPSQRAAAPRHLHG
jgi:aspartate-semialdehyde dehydrogenase